MQTVHTTRRARTTSVVTHVRMRVKPNTHVLWRTKMPSAQQQHQQHHAKPIQTVHTTRRARTTSVVTHVRVCVEPTPHVLWKTKMPSASVTLDMLVTPSLHVTPSQLTLTHTTPPDAHNTKPDAHNTKPDAHNTKPEAHNTKPDAHNTKPVANTKPPDAPRSEVEWHTLTEKHPTPSIPLFVRLLVRHILYPIQRRRSCIVYLYMYLPLTELCCFVLVVDIEVDKVTDMVVNMEVHKVVDMEVDKVADIWQFLNFSWLFGSVRTSWNTSVLPGKKFTQPLPVPLNLSHCLQCKKIYLIY